MDLKSDYVIPFQLEDVPVRGRLVRLKDSVKEIIERHQYPPIVNQFLTQLIALTTALSQLFKFESLFTLQIKSDGPIRLMIVDVTHEGEIRACARFDDSEVSKISPSTTSIYSVFGTGHLAFTIVQNNADDRYQGIVELNGPTLSDCLHHFFRQSDQLETGIVVYADTQSADSTNHVAGAIIVQRMPAPALSDNTSRDLEEDRWLKILSILGTATSEELLSKELEGQDVLYRLFWEDGVRVFSNRKIIAKCRCSRERVEDMLKTFSQTDIQDMIKDEQISVSCEFCNQEYLFDPTSLMD